MKLLKVKLVYYKICLKICKVSIFYLVNLNKLWRVEITKEIVLLNYPKSLGEAY